MTENVQLKEENLVLIEMPKLAVPKDLAEHYLNFINKICNDITNMQVQDFCDGDVVYKYENVYVNGEFYPVVCKRTNFENILNIFRPVVTHYDKFVEVEGEDTYSCRDRIVQLYKQTQKQEETV